MLFKTILVILATTILVMGSATDGTAASSAAGESVNKHGNGGGNSGVGEACGTLASEPGLSTEEIEALLFMREEEKVARDSYLVLENLWGLVIFGNISNSEQSHMDALEALIVCYGLTDPVIDEIGSFTNTNLQALFDYLMTEGGKSAIEGLYVGALIEETDIVDIQRSIDVTVHENIDSAYESLMCGSRNHLRAFIRQIESNGASYTPGVLDPDIFRAIAYSPVEQDCGGY